MVIDEEMGATVQVVDLRPGRRGTPPQVELWASTGAELIRATAAMGDCPCDQFDVGYDRLQELGERLDAETRALVDAQPEESWLFLTALVARLEEPGTVEDLLSLLEEHPLEVWRTLFEQPLGDQDASAPERWRTLVDDGAGETGDDAPELLDRYLAGDAEADEVRAWLATLENEDKLASILGPLLDKDPTEVVADFHRALTGVHRTVGAEMLAEAIGPMQREVVARRQQLDAGRHPGELVVEATNGYELSEDLPVDRVLLLPSYWFRPWLIINRVDSTEVLTSPVSDEHLALPSAAPPPSLVKLTKALGDEGRLRLLRRMGGGPITLADAMDELDLAKTTAHHHLSILRQAGLVVIRGEGRDSRYALRAHAPTAAAKALEEYLGSAVPLVDEQAAADAD